MARVALPSIGFLLLAFLAVFKLEAEGAKSSFFRRWKREWVIPPQKLEENVDHTWKTYIAKIRSDKEVVPEWKGVLRYSLRGKGATEEPVNLFIVDPTNGFVRITGTLDREKVPMFNLFGVARYANGEYAENNIELRIKVVDQNDCKPIFGPTATTNIDELSPKDTFIMNVTARDDDEPGNLNSKIAYIIIDQKPGGEQMFYIKKDGGLYVRSPQLNREVQDTYTLTILGRDLYGAPNGNTGTGNVVININDVNDNVPRLELEHYEGSIDENAERVEVMRFKAFDDDIENTDNWLAEFDIISGNELGCFEIETDPVTNEGVLILVKPVDYENVETLDLEVALSNKAPFHPSVAAGSATGVEGPRFNPKVKAVPISEDSNLVKLKDVIVRYPALDGDTGKDAKNVRYVKGYDPDNWLVIDEETAEVRLNRLPDRESKHLVNGTYIAKILCISQDAPYTTATGTIALQVEDHNDHCPELTATSQTLCTDDKVAYVTAFDADDYPHGAPFQFNLIPEETKGDWVVERLNDTSAILRTHDSLWPGPYEVTMEVSDQQGNACPDRQVMTVEVCTCDENQNCGQRGKSGTGAGFGGPGIGLLILGLLMLLLIPLLLMFCNCGGAGIGGIPAGFADMAVDTKEHLISYHTEGKGEDKDVPVLSAPVEMGGGYIRAVEAGQYATAGAMGAAGGAAFVNSFSTMGAGGG
ncbi:hypothetical protein SKAU_G00074140 [Synaphobranchus kaupii]|uniref:Cadherin domain-containing protein n=1 Tax=Synaphobranchus kaupii TaxID=118154 RepID=A0A9Q1G7B8_SYNKA|nr:hypothetical protein SKAU_G00074140 [Synaphobranchus kaupii]